VWGMRNDRCGALSNERVGGEIVALRTVLDCAGLVATKPSIVSTACVRSPRESGRQPLDLSPNRERLERRSTMMVGDGAFLTAAVIVSVVLSDLSQGAEAPSGDVSQPVGTVEVAAGIATALRNGVTLTLHAGDPVYKGDVVQTGSGGALKVSFTYGAGLDFGGSTVVALGDGPTEEMVPDLWEPPAKVPEQVTPDAVSPTDQQGPLAPRGSAPSFKAGSSTPPTLLGLTPDVSVIVSSLAASSSREAASDPRDTMISSGPTAAIAGPAPALLNANSLILDSLMPSPPEPRRSSQPAVSGSDSGSGGSPARNVVAGVPTQRLGDAATGTIERPVDALGAGQSNAAGGVVGNATDATGEVVSGPAVGEALDGASDAAGRRADTTGEVVGSAADEAIRGPLVGETVDRASEAPGRPADAAGEFVRRPTIAFGTVEGGDDLINRREAVGGITVSGMAEVGSTLRVNDAAVTVAPDGKWETTLRAPTMDGSLLVTAVATDAAGNEAAARRTLRVDITDPPAPVARLATDSGMIGDGITNSGVVLVSGLELDSAWQYRVNNGALTTGIGNTIHVPGDGPNSLILVQTDAAGNSSPEGSFTFVLDRAVSPALDGISGSSGINPELPNPASGRALVDDDDLELDGLNPGRAPVFYSAGIFLDQDHDDIHHLAMNSGQITFQPVGEGILLL